MMPTVLSALRDALGHDATMMTYLGGDYVKVGWVSETTRIPCVTIIENTSRSVSRPTHALNKHRDNHSTIQIDIWIDKTHEGFPCTNADIETIVSRIDELLFVTGVANTRSWTRVSSSGAMQEENIFHKALRYDFSYSVQD